MSDLSLRIGDVCTKIYSGGTPKSTIPEYYTPGTIPWLNSGEVQFKPIFRTEKYISEIGLVNSAAKWVYPPAVVVAMYGATAGNAAIVNTPLTTNQAICNLIIDSAKSDYRFVYYALTWLNESLASLTNGAAQQNLNAKTIADFCIPNLTLNAQRRIAAVLSAIDDKIELNRRLNDNLEAMAQALYDYWFVQFDFPDENGKPYKSSGGKMVWNEVLKREIPEGWKVGNSYDICELLNGLACQKYPACNGGIPVIKIKEMHGGYGKDTDFVSPDVPGKYIINNGDILFSWSATLEVMIWCGGLGCLNQHIFKVTPTIESKSFVYYQLKQLIQTFCRIAESRKTTMGHITTDHLQQTRFCIPSHKVLVDFESSVHSIIVRSITVQTESLHLTKQRDFLLPLLMNGLVQVKPLNYRLTAD